MEPKTWICTMLLLFHALATVSLHLSVERLNEGRRNKEYQIKRHNLNDFLNFQTNVLCWSCGDPPVLVGSPSEQNIVVVVFWLDYNCNLLSELFMLLDGVEGLSLLLKFNNLQLRH